MGINSIRTKCELIVKSQVTIIPKFFILLVEPVFKRKLLNKKFYSVFVIAILFIPVPAVSAISCIEPIRYGNLQVDVLPPISNLECKIMTLNIKIEQNENLNYTPIQLQLHNKTQDVIPHSSFLIAIKNQNKTVMEDLFHAHSGSLIIELRQIDDVKEWTLVGDNEKLGIGWTNDNDVYAISTPPVKKPETYEVYVTVFNVYDDIFSFKPDERPKFNFRLNSDESGQILQLNTELKQQGYKSDENEFLIQPLPPLKQLKSGLEIDQIVCKIGQALVVKSSDGSPVCVKPETKEKLIERGWAKLV